MSKQIIGGPEGAALILFTLSWCEEDAYFIHQGGGINAERPTDLQSIVVDALKIWLHPH